MSRRAPLSLIVMILLGISLCAGASAAVQPLPTRDAPAIINGSTVTAQEAAPGGRWSSLVALVSATSANAFQGQFCGGTLIDVRWVITAAHCVYDDFDGDAREETLAPAMLHVLAGQRDLSAAGGQRVAAAAVIVHPSYPATGRDDIALVQLASPVAETVAGAMQPAGPGDEPAWAAGQTLHIAGWGNQTPTLCSSPTSCAQPGPDAWPTIAQHGSITRADDAACATGPAPGFSFFDASVWLCAGVLDTDGAPMTTNGIDTCQGDSGGPLISDPMTGPSARRLVGITSFGLGCGSNTYGIYTRVASYYDWIQAELARAAAAPTSGGGHQQPTTPAPDPTLRGEHDAPAAPRSLRVAAQTLTSVTIAWDAPAAAALGGYAVSLETGNEHRVPASTRSVTVTGLAPGAEVLVSVRATGPAGEQSPPATLRAASLRDRVAPSAPGAAKVRAKGRALIVSWAAARDNHRVTRYRVSVRIGVRWKTLTTVPASRRSMQLRTVPRGARAISVQAIDASGNVSRRSKLVRIPASAASAPRR